MTPTFEEEMLACRRWLQKLDIRVSSQAQTDESLSERISALAAAIDRNYRVLVKQIPAPKRLTALEDRLDALEESTTDPDLTNCPQSPRLATSIPETKQWGWQTYGSTIKIDVDTMTNECPVICFPGTFGWAFELMRRGRWLTYGVTPHFQYTMGSAGFLGKSPGGLPFDCPVCVSMLMAKTWKLAE